MTKNGLRSAKRLGYAAAAAVLCLLALVLITGRLNRKTKAEQASLLREAVVRAAVTCYAIEGRYPPDIQYIIDHYGVRVDSDEFIVSYDAYADNLMPDVRVIERGRSR